MSNFRERLRTLKTGLWVPPTSRTRFIRCSFLGGCKRFFALPAVLDPMLVTVIGTVSPEYECYTCVTCSTWSDLGSTDTEQGTRVSRTVGL